MRYNINRHGERKLHLLMNMKHELRFSNRDKNVLCKFYFLNEESEPLASVCVAAVIEGVNASNIFDKKETGWGLRDEKFTGKNKKRDTNIPDELHVQIIDRLNDLYPD